MLTSHVVRNVNINQDLDDRITKIKYAYTRVSEYGIIKIAVFRADDVQVPGPLIQFHR
jgi:hypothetical protein